MLFSKGIPDKKKYNGRRHANLLRFLAKEERVSLFFAITVIVTLRLYKALTTSELSAHLGCSFVSNVEFLTLSKHKPARISEINASHLEIVSSSKD